MAAYVYFAIETFGRPNRVFEAEIADFQFVPRTTERAYIAGFNEPIKDKATLQMLKAIGLALPEGKIKIETETHDVIAGKLYESKTNRTWKKFVYNKKAVAVLKQWLATRKGKKKWFGNDNEEFPQFAKRINAMLKEGYEAIGATNKYFYERPSYALRHCGAHLWLRRTGYNYGAVAKMGWEDISTLRTWYGDFDTTQLEDELQKV